MRNIYNIVLKQIKSSEKQAKTDDAKASDAVFADTVEIEHRAKIELLSMIVSRAHDIFVATHESAMDSGKGIAGSSFDVFTNEHKAKADFGVMIPMSAYDTFIARMHGCRKNNSRTIFTRKTNYPRTS